MSYTQEEWRVVYDTTLIDVLKICTGYAITHDLCMEADDISQQCELVFFECYYEWINGNVREFPPPRPYFCARCVKSMRYLVLGRCSPHISFLEPDDYQFIYARRRVRDESRMDYLDLYLSGVNISELADVFHKHQVTISKWIGRRQKGMATRDGKTVKEIKAMHLIIHKQHRAETMGKMLDAGLNIHYAWNRGERPPEQNGQKVT